MPNEKNTFDVKLEGIGPFADPVCLRFDSGDTRADIRLGVYAANGVGKTFISRCFSEFARMTTGGDICYPKEHLISFGKTAGEFAFDVRIKGGASSAFTMPVDKHNTPISPAGAPDIIFHVFNSDYVKKQFAGRKYVLNDNIKGEVTVGEANVRTEALAQEIKDKLAENKATEKTVEAAIAQAKAALRTLYKIVPSMTDFNTITPTTVIKGIPRDLGGKTLADLASEYEAFNLFAAKEDTSDVPPLPPFKYVIAARSIDKALSVPHTPKTIQGAFLEKIRSKRNFIQTGLILTQDGKCPYCGQPLDGAQELIAAYHDYFDETQRAVEQTFLGYKAQFDILETDLNTLAARSGESVKQLNALKDFFPSTKGIVINPIVLPQDLMGAITRCKATLQEKITDISTAGLAIAPHFETVKAGLAHVMSQRALINADVSLVNKTTHHINDELKAIKRGLCAAYFNGIIADNRAGIDAYHANLKGIEAAREELLSLQAITPRKDLVYSTFCDLIKRYFGDKYSVESGTFRMRLNTQNLAHPDMVLSDGEKSITAFCYYLASTHSKVADSADYDNLIFVIDDPIPSMDFTCVYETAQIIKDLGAIINGRKPKYLILTHNAEFMNLLYASDLLSQGYHLEKGQSGEIALLRNGPQGIDPDDGRTPGQTPHLTPESEEVIPTND